MKINNIQSFVSFVSHCDLCHCPLCFCCNIKLLFDLLWNSIKNDPSPPPPLLPPSAWWRLNDPWIQTRPTLSRPVLEACCLFLFEGSWQIIKISVWFATPEGRLGEDVNTLDESLKFLCPSYRHMSFRVDTCWDNKAHIPQANGLLPTLSSPLLFMNGFCESSK